MNSNNGSVFFTFFNFILWLYKGPPGCAKTSLARAAAGSAEVAFLSLSPAEVYASSYVGEAETIVRRSFALARCASPCILFFDEIDAILGTDAGSSHGMDRRGRESSSEARVLSTFLNEMDGVDSSSSDGVLVLGATNRPTVLDAALLRPGRFDKIIFVPPPDEGVRRSLFSLQLARGNTNPTVDVDYLASDAVSGRLTGAEVVGACREAAMLAIREAFENNHQIEHTVSARCFEPCVTQQHVERALQGLKPMLTNDLLVEYRRFEEANAMRK